MTPLRIVAAASVVALCPPDRAADAAYRIPPVDYRPVLELAGRVPGGERPATGGPAHLTGATIASLSDGALVIDAESGLLIRTGAGDRPIATLEVGRDAGLLVFDPIARRAYVTDRRRDRIAVVDVTGAGLAQAAWIATPAEPFGLALAPDRRTLLVTAIADRVVVALDPATGVERWREPIGAEPRGIAIDPDGRRAIVAHLTTGAVELIDLGGAHRVRAQPLAHDLGTTCAERNRPVRRLNCADRGAPSFARGAYAVTFLGSALAAVAFQREAPVPRRADDDPRRYGGSAIPVTRHLAFLQPGGHQTVAQIGPIDPRALVWDARRDVLAVAGMADDTIVEVDDASQRTARAGRSLSLSGTVACGPAGLAIADGGDLLVWCALSRSIARLTADGSIDHGPELAPSPLTAAQRAGFVQFHTASEAISAHRRASCATCHLDGRSDGLAWRIADHALQTPVLAGRLAGTAPFKWTGGDADLYASVTSTIQRLGGSDPSQTAALAAYLETLPSVRAPSRRPAAVARGKRLFESAELGCAECHGAPAYTDAQRHHFTGASLDIDTPSLRAVAASAPYFHDGSAPTLDDVLGERGSIRGMVRRALSGPERADLIAFLETL